MKELSSLSNKSTTEKCETVLKRKHGEIILNLNLISDDSNSFSENSFDEPITLPSSDSASESPVKLSISNFFLKRKPSFDHEDSLEEPPKTSTPLPKEEKGDENNEDPPKPRKVARKEKKSPSFPCHLCPKSFVFEIHLKKHLQQHKEGFHCKFCGRSFANKDKVCKHEKSVHVARTLYTCDQCSKSFRANTSLTAHRALHSSTAEKFYCKYCGKNYVLKRSYKKHLQTFPSHDVSDDLKSL